MTFLSKYTHYLPKAQAGGPGSGHFGHQGRPGERGGSLPGEGGNIEPVPSWDYLKGNVFADEIVRHGGDEAKWNRITLLDKRVLEITKAVDMDIARGENLEEARCLRLIIDTGIRPGSEKETKVRGFAYGATTLEGRHVQLGTTGRVYLRFIGKSGVRNSIPVDNPEIAADLVARATKAGPEGKLFDTSYAKLLAYSQVTSGGFLTKDFRTLIATKLAYELVAHTRRPKTFKEYKKKVREVARRVADKIGNTTTVALQKYIHPAVFLNWHEAVA